ncbi:MAG: amidohydrolase family protein [Solirubrobacteraceae bacterium]
MNIDVHQHIWTEPLLGALTARRALPFVRRIDGLTVLHSLDEQPYVIDVAAEAPARRAALVHDDGLDLALIALSSPIGIEALPRESATALIAAHLDGVRALGPEFAPWGPVALDDPDPYEVDQLLAQGCIGISLPAGALTSRAALDALAPVLERVAARQVPLFVHPGRALGQPGCPPTLDEPLWWRALTDYVAQMQAAWLTLTALGRRDHPELQIVFAMLAGCAPLLGERLAARGGPAVDLRDPLIFYDTSSYGRVAIETVARVVGSQQLVYGSDRPVVEPTLTGREAILKTNATRILEPVEVAA